jgi:hypothetical protein
MVFDRSSQVSEGSLFLRRLPWSRGSGALMSRPVVVLLLKDFQILPNYARADAPSSDQKKLCAGSDRESIRW